MIVRTAVAAAIFFTPAVGLAAAPPPPNPFESGRTMAGQALEVPEGPLQVNVASSVFQAGDVIPTHLHFWSRYVFVQSGTVEVTLIDQGITQTFTAGQVIVEPIGLWHKGRIIAGPANLIYMEQVPPGRVNKIEPPACNCPPPR
jgi:quercetin dioxygenase-like cupin family protein